jgi:hypothetical protein
MAAYPCARARACAVHRPFEGGSAVPRAKHPGGRAGHRHASHGGPPVENSPFSFGIPITDGRRMGGWAQDPCVPSPSRISHLILPLPPTPPTPLCLPSRRCTWPTSGPTHRWAVRALNAPVRACYISAPYQRITLRLMNCCGPGAGRKPLPYRRVIEEGTCGASIFLGRGDPRRSATIRGGGGLTYF